MWNIVRKPSIIYPDELLHINLYVKGCLDCTVGADAPTVQSRQPLTYRLMESDPHDRDIWRSGVRSAMRAASQLLGRGPTVVDMAPVPAR